MTPGVSATRLVVFDCDGTLVDSQHAIVEAMTQAFAGHSLPLPDAESVRRVVGLALPEAVARLMPLAAMDRLDSVSTAYKDAFTDIRLRPGHEEPLYPGVREALTLLLESGAMLGVATGKSRNGLLRVLEVHGLRDSFITLKTADDGPGKPNPDILLDAMAETGAMPETTVMIGDTTFDIEMAVRARALSIGVAWGYHPSNELTAAGALRIAKQYGELPTMIANLWETGS
jgi:phosphoglycolate phosphatase